MGRDESKKTKREEAKAEIICQADKLMDRCDELDRMNSRSLTADYADDEPRKEVVRGLDDLHRGLYGTLPDRIHAQVTHIMTKLTEQEKLDRDNDALKQAERKKIDEIKEAARTIRNEIRGKR